MFRILIYSKQHETTIREYLSGFLLNFISTPTEFESILQKETFDLIVMEYGEDSLNLIDSLNRNFSQIHFPLVLAIVEEKGVKLDRIDDFLSSPFSKDELLKRIFILEEKRRFFHFFSALKEITLEEAEKFLILNAVEKQNGSKSKAAKILGISTRTIELKFRKWGITPR